MTSPTFEVSGSVIAFADSGTATTFSVTPEAVTFNVVNVAGYTVAVTELDQLSDVNTSGVANGDVLLYDSGTWVAGTATGSGGTASIVLAGDVVGTAVAGTVTTDIADSGVAAGTYGASGTAVIVTVAADGRITAISGTAISGGGDSLPTQTGNGGAVLGTNGTATSWARSFTSPDGKSRAIADDTYAAAEYTDGATSTTAVADSLGAMVSATNGTDEATARVNTDGSLELIASGAATLNGSALVTGARTISTTAPLSGGGDLSANRTLTIADATTSVKGAVQLTDSTSSTSTTTAATPNSVKSAYDLANGAVPKSLADAKGDLFVATADNTVARLAVGANDYVLTADSSQSTGVKWAAASGGGGGGLVLVDSGTFTAVSALSLPNGSFDGTYDDYFLDLVVSCSNGSPQVCRVRMRSSGSDDTSSNYNFQQNYTTGSSAGTSLDKGALLSIAGGKTAAKIQITSPALSEHTFLYDNYVYSSGAGAIESGFYATVHRVASAFDSLTVFPDGGSDTLTGRWSLYGYAK